MAAIPKIGKLTYAIGHSTESIHFVGYHFREQNKFFVLIYLDR